MARRNVNNDIPTSPQASTRSLPPNEFGVQRGIDGSAWLWRKVPTGALLDAKTDNDKAALGNRLYLAAQEICALSARGQNRQMAKGGYRRVKVAAFNVPVWFEAPPGTPTKELLDNYFHEELVMKRLVLFGVKLIPHTTLKARTFRGKVRELLDTIEQTALEGAAPTSDFDRDRDRVTAALARASLDLPEPGDLRFADSWWNFSMERQTSRTTPYVQHTDHMHFLRTTAIRRDLERFGEDRHCDDWPDELRDSPEQVAVTIGAIEGFNGVVDALDPRAPWAMQLFNSNARAITIEGLLEPPENTRKAIAKTRQRYQGDVDDFASINKNAPVDMREHMDKLAAFEEQYSESAAPPPTLIDASALVAFDGRIDDLMQVTPPALNIDPMTNLQEAAFHEMMLCSSVHANPHKLEFPTTNVAYAGFSALTEVGDRYGALAGFTEHDRQPVWVSGYRQSDGEQLPIMQVAATTGSGKLLTLDTLIHTPSGPVPMGELEVGDEVLGRDRGTYQITGMSPIDPNPELFRVTLSDGQQIDACVSHQWVVIPPVALQPRFEHLVGAADRIDAQLVRVPRFAVWGAERIAQWLQEVTDGAVPWVTGAAVESMLKLLDIDLSLPASVLIAALARRARWIAQEQRSLGDGEVVMTTGELAAAGPGFTIAASRGTVIARRMLSMLIAESELLELGGGRVGIRNPAEVAASAILRIARDAGMVARLDGDIVSWMADPDKQRFEVMKLEPIESRPGRCITVDSPDSTYLCADLVPTHNTMLLLWLAHQWNIIGHPQFILDPKKNSDHSGAVQAFGGRTASFSDLEGADGPLDPIRFMKDPRQGVQLAADMLMSIAPWPDEPKAHETDIGRALSHGVAKGARATGEALQIALRDGVVSEQTVAPVFDFANTYTMFRTTFGMGRSENPFDLGEGLTLFRVGETEFEMPDPADSTPPHERRAIVRASSNAMRMMIRAATTALAGRSGIIHLDEAWVVELLAKGETNQLGRLARQMDVFPILYNQTPSTAVEAKVENYISSGFLGYLKSEAEATAGLKLLGMEGNDLVRRRVLTPRGDGSGGTNWGSLQHLYAPGGGRKVIRGSVFYHADSLGRIGATEIVLPKQFLDLASTNPDDIRNRTSSSPQ